MTKPDSALLALCALAACATEDTDSGPTGDGCTITAEITDRDLTATAHYGCTVAEVTATINAYLEIDDARFWFGTHGQIISCGSSLTERYRLPNGGTSYTTVVVAGFRQGEVTCESRLP